MGFQLSIAFNLCGFKGISHPQNVVIIYSPSCSSKLECKIFWKTLFESQCGSVVLSFIIWTKIFAEESHPGLEQHESVW